MGQLSCIEQRHILQHVMSCSAIKAMGKEEEGGTFMQMAFIFLSNCYTC